MKSISGMSLFQGTASEAQAAGPPTGEFILQVLRFTAGESRIELIDPDWRSVYNSRSEWKTKGVETGWEGCRRVGDFKRRACGRDGFALGCGRIGVSGTLDFKEHAGRW